jgi:hypothetical protein
MTINNLSEMKNQTSTMKKDGQEENPENKYLRQLYSCLFLCPNAIHLFNWVKTI